MVTYYLMVSSMYLHDTLDESIITAWFPLHFIHGTSSQHATAFSIVGSREEVLDVLLKAQLMLGRVVLLTQDEFGHWLRSFDNDAQDAEWPDVERAGGAVVTLRSWLMRMRRAHERDAGDLDEKDEEEGLDDEQYATATSSVLENEDDDFMMDLDSNDDDDDDVDDDIDIDDDNDRDRDDGRLYTQGFLSEKILEEVLIELYERNGWPLSSSYGAII
ncbi:hypothetical protein PHSY_002894 [Pseudozyma hubeiensis SY62]|uniref:Uncharacterized protein n=1 Tax=Pseudozyma hubeiensis (strain SY62) TaxID=1305764 RepID=R9P266_PSEHS|nr:hypothetical protein PHSY_002894 [Pseudozyma hubeiensis SY62]GAC95319.1 hypothetical protein PHSY_002894 [Pseudozyma hubeiensis SY62]